MSLQLLTVSFIGYMIIVNCSLTFWLSAVDNIILAILILINMVGVGVWLDVGSLFVIPMYIMIYLYIYSKNKDRLLNLFLLLFSYMASVIIDNITHLIWTVAGFNIDTNLYILYMLINFPIYILVYRGVSKKAKRFMGKGTIPLSPRVSIVVGSNIILCTLMFAIYIYVMGQVGYTSIMLLISIVLYLAYFLLTGTMIISIIKSYEKNAEILLKQNSYDNLQEYIGQVEGMYQSLRTFKHDYSNIMASLAGYIEIGDVDGLREYYQTSILPIGYKLKSNQNTISKLYNLDIIELKSLISIKLNYAQELNIDVNLEIMEKIEKINMNIVDLARIIGILLDNAIEACQECEEPFINLSIIRTQEDITIIVKNTYIKQDLDYSKLGSIGISSKGERRGIGLYNIKTIIGQYDNVIIDTSYEERYFTQVLEIYGTM